MKKIYFLLIAISVNSLTFGQWSNQPIVVGDSLANYLVTNAPQLATNANSNGPWNFSTAISSTIPSITKFIAAANAPNASSFPTATIAQIDDGDLTSVSYWGPQNGNIYQIGSFSGLTKTTYTNTRLGWVFPLLQNTNITDNYSATIANGTTQIGTISGKINMKSLSVSSLTLPNNVTFNNVLKANFYDTAITTTLVGTDTTILNFNYYYPINFKFPAFIFGNANSGGFQYQIAQILEPSVISALDKVEKKYKFNLLGNKCNDELNYEISIDNNITSGEYQIISISGQTILSHNLSLNNGYNRRFISTSSLASGIYIFNIKLNNESINAYFIKE